MVSPDGETVWTDSPEAYAGWTATDEAPRLPKDFEKLVNGKWVVDGAAKAAADEESRLARMTAKERHAEAVETARLEIIADMEREGIVTKAAAGRMRRREPPPSASK